MTRQDADQAQGLSIHGEDLVKVVWGLTTIESLGILVHIKETPRVVQRRVERRVRRLVTHEEGEGEDCFGVGGEVAREIERKVWVACDRVVDAKGLLQGCRFDGDEPISH